MLKRHPVGWLLINSCFGFLYFIEGQYQTPDEFHSFAIDCAGFIAGQSRSVASAEQIRQHRYGTTQTSERETSRKRLQNRRKIQLSLIPFIVILKVESDEIIADFFLYQKCLFCFRRRFNLFVNGVPNCWNRRWCIQCAPSTSTAWDRSVRDISPSDSNEPQKARLYKRSRISIYTPMN